MNDMLSIALPKGRLGEKAYGVFEALGLGCPSILAVSQGLCTSAPAVSSPCDMLSPALFSPALFHPASVQRSSPQAFKVLSLPLGTLVSAPASSSFLRYHSDFILCLYVYASLA